MTIHKEFNSAEYEAVAADLSDAAKAQPHLSGPANLPTAQKDDVHRMRDEEYRPATEIARLFKVSERTVRRA